MSDIIYIGKSAKSAENAPQFDSYSKVVLVVSDEMEYTSGTDTGRTLTLTNPFGTQQMCDDILNYIRGFAYQPVEASKAELDPAAELGDGIDIASTYSGIYKQVITFGSRMVSDVSAPFDNEIDHEIPYVSTTDREITRRFADTQSALTIQADSIKAEVTQRTADSEEFRSALEVQAGEISAKVDAQGGDDTSMGWTLVPGEFRVTAKGTTVFSVDADGAYIKGQIEATSGSIGNMALKDGALTTNGMTWGSTLNYGLYLGSNGIQIGQNFKVDSAGNLTAATGTFSGSVKAGSILYGGSNGTFNGAGLTSGSVSGGAIVSGGLTTTQMSSGINTSLGYADYANGIINGRYVAPLLMAQSISAVSSFYLTSGTMYINGYRLKLMSRTINGTSYNLVEWGY